jgi:hypothetical protein
MLIDGGMGEIARRQFMNRLLIRGRNALRKKDPHVISSYLRTQRASIFNPQVTSVMQNGAERQIEGLLGTLPSVEDIGEENFADLLIVRYRFPNYGGLDQSRMDGQILSYMPFAQPSFVRAAFATPLKLKRDAHLFRRLIDQYRPSLKKYPLVKGYTTYPYMLPAIPAMVWTKVKTIFGRGFDDPTPAGF